MGAAMFLPRHVFDECGPWDADFTFGAEDLHFSACVGRRYPLMFVPEIELTHFGGVSTRQHAGFVTAAQAAGLVHFLRKSGYSRPALLAYKLAVTLDTPLQFVTKGAHYLGRRLRGDAAAARTRIAWRATGHFLTRGLAPFWRA
jgi:hypothetical protein